MGHTIQPRPCPPALAVRRHLLYIPLHRNPEAYDTKTFSFEGLDNLYSSGHDNDRYDSIHLIGHGADE